MGPYTKSIGTVQDEGATFIYAGVTTWLPEALHPVIGRMLAELAVNEPKVFASLVDTAKKALPSDVNAPKSA